MSSASLQTAPFQMPRVSFGIQLAKEGRFSDFLPSLEGGVCSPQEKALLFYQIAEGCLQDKVASAAKSAIQALATYCPQEASSIFCFQNLGGRLVHLCLSEKKIHEATEALLVTQNPFYQLSVLHALREDPVAPIEEKFDVKALMEEKIRELPLEKEQRHSYFLQLAITYLKEQEWKRASIAFGSILAEDPWQEEALKGKLQCFLALEDWKGISSLATHLVQKENLSNLVLLMSDLCREKGQKDLAFRLVQGVLRKRPDHRSGVSRLLLWAFPEQEESVGDIASVAKAAARFLESPSTQSEESRMHWLVEGLKTIFKERSQEMLFFLESIWMQRETNSPCFLRISKSFVEAQKAQKAIEILLKVGPFVQKESQVEEAQSQILSLFAQDTSLQNQLHACIFTLQNSREQKIDLLMRFAWFHFHQKNKARAWELVQCVLKVHPENQAAHYLGLSIWT